MHPSSKENMQKALSRYVGAAFFADRPRRVVEVGSSSVNGSYRPLFADYGVDYLGLDLQAGSGVDQVLDEAYAYPVATGSADLVISGQMLEHCEYPWLAFQEMARILSPDGYLILIAPSAGPIHRYPVDCYRFYPDAYRALARLAGCVVVALWHDERGPWRDLVGVFSKNPAKENSPMLMPPALEAPPPFKPAHPMSSDSERVAGAAPYLDVLTTVHATLAPRSYLEIGIRRGDSLGLARRPAIAIDPCPHPEFQPGADVRLFRMSSDDFFELEADRALTDPVDLAFIDGMHLFEYALRDFIKIERRCSPTSVIVIDDVFPNSIEQAQRERCTRCWTGDVWKLLQCLRNYRPDLVLVPIDTDPTGLLLVLGLSPRNRQLVDQYNPIVAKFNKEAGASPPAAIIDRVGAIHPEDPAIAGMLDDLRRLREGGSGTDQTSSVRRSLRRYVREQGPRTR
ncbi:MAG: methyltransferase domain-containing protein [Methylotetracoccus sp.]